MAFESSPQRTWNPAFAPIAFTLSHPESHRPQFSFVADVYVYPGGAQTLLGRLRAPAIGGLGLFDVAPLLASTLDPQPELRSGFSLPEGWWGEFSVTFHAEWEVDGVLTLDSGDSLDSGRLYHYAAASALSSDPEGGQRMPFLLSQPRERTLASSSSSSDAVGVTVRPEERVSLMWIRPVDGLTPARAFVAAYGPSGQWLWNRVFAISPPWLSQPGIKAFGAGPIQINELARQEAEPFPPINGAVHSYTVQLVTSASLPASEMVRFTLDRRPFRKATVRVHWLNALGGLDSASFRVSESVGAERQQSYTGDWALKGADYVARVPRNGWVTTASPRMTADLESNPVNWRGYEALTGLALSPRVWVHFPKTPLVAVESDALGTRLADESLRGINFCDRDFTLTSFHWVTGGASQFEDASQWMVDDYGLSFTAGRIPFAGVPSGACLYEEGMDLSSLVSVAPSQPRWTPAKDNLRLFSFSAELPPPPSQWR